MEQGENMMHQYTLAINGKRRSVTSYDMAVEMAISEIANSSNSTSGRTISARERHQLFTFLGSHPKDFVFHSDLGLEIEIARYIDDVWQTTLNGTVIFIGGKFGAVAELQQSLQDHIADPEQRARCLQRAADYALCTNETELKIEKDKNSWEIKKTQ